MGLRRYFFGEKEPTPIFPNFQFGAYMRGIFNGKDCLVVGSAPSFQYAPHERCICVNGSGVSAALMGIDNPDLTIIAGWTLRGDTPVRSATIDAITGLRTKAVLVLDAGVPFPIAAEKLAQISYMYSDILPISSGERISILEHVCGKKLMKGDHHQKPSNGLFAVALALWSGARSVTMTGFSLSGGHSYIDGDTPREHLAGDQWFLKQTSALPIVIL